MSPSLSWIDRHRLEAALERAGVGRAHRAAPRAQPGPARPRALVRTSVPQSTSGPPSQRLIEGERLHDRLEQLMGHVQELTGAEDLFVADDQGLTLCERGSREALRPVGAAFAHFKNRVDRSFEAHTSSNLAIDLDREGVLHVLTVDSGTGSYALCFLAPEAASRPRLTEILALTRNALDDSKEC